MWQNDFKGKLEQALLELAWRQWTQFGVAGHGKTGGAYILDPEALLLFTAYIGRRDQRLFDEVVDWLAVNHRFINVQRLRALSKRVEFEHRAILGLIAAYMTAVDKTPKWRRLAEEWLPTGANGEQSLFTLSGGSPMPVLGDVDAVAQRYGFRRNSFRRSNNSGEFSARDVATLMLQLRGFFGVNARSETMLGLLTRDVCTVQDVADLSGFTWRSIQDVLVEMALSGRVGRSKGSRGYLYFLNDPRVEWSLWFPEYCGGRTFVDWLSVYRGCVIVLEGIDKAQRLARSALAQRSVVQELFDDKIQWLFMDAGINTELKFLRHDNVEELPCLLADLT